MWLFCFHVYLCTTCMQCSQRPERASHSLELEWQMIVNFCAGSWTCSQPLNHPPFKRCSSTELCPRCAHVYTTSLCSSVHDPIIHVLCLFLKTRKYLRKLILGPRHLCLFLFWDRVNFVAWIAWNFLVDQAGLKLTEICLPLHSWVLGLKVSATMPSLGLNIWKCVFSGSPLWLTLENEWQAHLSSAYFTEQHTKTVHFVILIKSVDSPFWNKVDSRR